MKFQQVVRTAKHALTDGTSMSANLPIEAHLPPFDGATTWLNARPLSLAAVRGRIVLVDFCTYTCVNWLRTLPYVRAWAEKYKDHGLVVIGVHTPEFPFEHDLANVRRAMQEMAVTYPIAVDNDYAIWDAFANRYWPALYLADAGGRIRYHHFGESAYVEAERTIQQLLADAGQADIDRCLVSPAAGGLEVAADWDTLRSSETYLGYARTERFASPGGIVADERRTYASPEQLRLNAWALAGTWVVGTQAAVLHEADGRLTYRFHARDVNLVMGPAARDTAVRFRVRIDGEPPGDGHGGDIDADGNGTVREQRPYQLIRQPARIADRQIEIAFLDAGIEAYDFTFG